MLQLSIINQANYSLARQGCRLYHKPYHPQTQGKIESWHRFLTISLLLENYNLPGELENQIQQFINCYNHKRYHESFNLTNTRSSRNSGIFQVG